MYTHGTAPSPSMSLLHKPQAAKPVGKTHAPTVLRKAQGNGRFIRLDQVQFYASIRPNYPPELFHFVASKAPSRHLAWDAGTGSGQAAVSLSSLFDSVVATDSSPEQISHAPTNLSNIRFVLTPPSLTLSDLHRLVAPPGSVDLITVATALHWFDIPAFFAQARSVLRRPSGVLAAWCYDYRLVVDGGMVDEIYRRLGETMWTYIRKDIRVLVEEGYERLEFPFEGVDGVEKGTGPVRRFVAEREMGVEGLIALTKTLGGVSEGEGGKGGGSYRRWSMT